MHIPVTSVGLIKYKSDDIRPTFLSQTQFSSIRLDIPGKVLQLSPYCLIGTEDDAVPLLDLRGIGDPVRHYIARVKELRINDKLIGKNEVIYAVFDTGTSGCVLQDELYNDEETPIPPRSISVVLVTEKGGLVTLTARASRDQIFVVTASDIRWFKYQRSERSLCRDRAADEECKVASGKTPKVIVLGSAFLDNKVLTIDADQNRLTIL